MSEEFERYKDSYRAKVEESIGFVHQDLDFFTEAKARHIVRLATTLLGDTGRLSVLDVGCGVGLTDSYLESRFGRLSGVDVSPGVIETAARANPWAEYATYDGRKLPYDDECFDLTFAICVMHHVPTEFWLEFVAEMRRVTRPGGLVTIFEHNPLNPLTRVAVSRCEFDVGVTLLRLRTARELLRHNRMEPSAQSYILFFPWRVEALQRAERALRGVPLGAQYFVAGRVEVAAPESAPGDRAGRSKSPA
ncbi:MAG: class I SAM-dependent methyltransferase [Actinomycetota bacterium]